MDYGVHLPVIDFGFQRFSLERLAAYVKTAGELGFKAVSTNDHLIHSRPWLDAPTALTAVLSETGSMAVGTSVTLPIVRGPVPLAKTLAAIDILSNGRLFVGLGPGSSARDYEIVGMRYEERWKRFDEVVQFLRALWSVDGAALPDVFTPMLTLNSSPSRSRDQLRRFGSAVGVRTLACGESLDSPMDGWLPPITRRPINSRLG